MQKVGGGVSITISKDRAQFGRGMDAQDPRAPQEAPSESQRGADRERPNEGRFGAPFEVCDLLFDQS